MVLTKTIDKLRTLRSSVSSSLSIISCPNLWRWVAGAEYRTAAVALAVVRIATLAVCGLDGTSR